MTLAPMKFLSKKEIFFLVAVFALALVLRLAYVIFLKNNYLFFDQPGSDVKYYQEWAEAIAYGDWIGQGPFYGMPLYAYFLAVLKRLALGHDLLVRFFHLILGSSNCILVYLLARKIFSQPVALAASLMTATNFILIYYDWLMMPVGLIIFLSLLIALFLLEKEGLHKNSEWLILGLLAGLTALGDGKMIIFLGLFSLWVLIDKKWKPFWRRFFFLALGFLLVLGGTALRNRLVSGDWILISAQTGLSFYVGNNPASDGLYENPAFIRPTHGGQDEDQQLIAQEITQKALSPAQISALWRNLAMSFIKNSPGEYLQLLARKFFLFFREIDSPDEIDLLLQKEWQRRLDINSFYIMCPLAVLGLILAWRNRLKGPGFINLFLLSQLIFTLMFFLTTRHRATVLPFFILYECYALVWLIQQGRKRAWKPLAAACGGLLLTYLVFKPVELPAVTIDFIRHANAGVLYAKQDRHALARMHYTKALAIQPFDTNTLFNMANSFYNEGDYEMAQGYYEKTIALFPMHVDARFNLGYTLEKKGELKAALEIFTKLRQDQPQQTDILYRMASIYAELKECGKIQDLAAVIVQEDPRFADEMKKLTDKCQ